MNDITLTARKLGATLDTNRVCDRCPGRTFCQEQPTPECYIAQQQRATEFQLDDYLAYRNTQLLQRRERW